MSESAIPAPTTKRPAAAAAAEKLPLGGELPAHLSKPRIVVLKAHRRLAVYDGTRLVKVYSIALGSKPTGDKVREGDRRTPEGAFRVCTKNGSSRFHLSLGLSYPNAEDAERGLRDGLITRAEHGAIVDAIDAGRRPPWDTRLGGEIMIHGVDDKPRHGDWTTGCIALTNPEIDELFAAVPMGATVEIRP